MIDELHIQDVALIQEATIDPDGGLTVLTGETGAGKSALLSSIKLLSGERADASAVREGAEALVVEGRFFLRGGDPDGCIVRRRFELSGRGRVEVDGHMASVRELAEGVGASIELCGQHEHQRLLTQSNHAAMLDAWIGDAAKEALDAYNDALACARAAAEELARVQEDSRTCAERLEGAQFTLERIDRVAPREGEYGELEQALPRLTHAEALMEAAAGSREALSGDDGVLDRMATTLSALRDASRYDKELATLADSLEGALFEVEEVASSLRNYCDRMEFDPAELDRMQSRMAALRGLLRSYGPRMSDVFARREKAAHIVEAARDRGTAEHRACKAYEQAEALLAMRADELDALRQGAAPRFSDQVSQQMALVEMGTARIEVQLMRLDRAQWTREGPSRVELLYRPAAGLTPRPLRRIASGGEISRVMLAIKVILGEADGTDTLVFDEVDSGVGGVTAVSIAKLLARLARTHQVIVVTHLAQIAVYADRHYLVSKTTGDVPKTTIEQISGEARIREIARMLSGDATEASLAHARDMLSGALPT